MEFPKLYSPETLSPVHYVHIKLFVQFVWRFLESFEPTEPEKVMFTFLSKHSMPAVLDFQKCDYFVLTFCNLSASRHLRLLILVSKHTFSETMNIMGQLIMRYI